MNGNRKTEVDYWDDNWEKASAQAIRPKNCQEPYLWGRLRAILDEVLLNTKTKGAKFIEIGAGGSEWLVLFKSTYDVNVSGVDYSSVGCKKTTLILEENGIVGQIYCADMFAPPEDLIGEHDIVASFGLVEHFQDTVGAIKACASFGKKGGIIITAIPNMLGLNGLLYKIFNRKVFETHVPISLVELVALHKESGMEPLVATYVFSAPGVFDEKRQESGIFKFFIRTLAHRITRFYWKLEGAGFGLKPNKLTSPYMICICRI